jgi:DNA-binding transcriptional regulator YdaS (Cro superfamily)
MTTQQNSESRNFALEAIEHAGGFATVARKFEISYAAVRKWAETQRIPSERILRVCQLCNNAVTPHQLNPLVYPEDFRA